MRSKTRSAALAALCAGVLTFAACGSDDSSDESGGSTTVTWWHNSNNEPGMGYYEQVAKDYEADHPGVKIKISAMAHEDMVDSSTLPSRAATSPTSTWSAAAASWPTTSRPAW